MAMLPIASKPAKRARRWPILPPIAVDGWWIAHAGEPSGDDARHEWRGRLAGVAVAR